MRRRTVCIFFPGTWTLPSCKLRRFHPTQALPLRIAPEIFNPTQSLPLCQLFFQTKTVPSDTNPSFRAVPSFCAISSFR
jgi:hypothetical protein